MLIRALLLSLPFWSAAQPMPPRIELQTLAKDRLSSLPVGAVGVGNCFSHVDLREMTEVAVLTISVNGPWERSAEHMAKQKAAEAGANCLQPVTNYGPEEDHYPIVRQYRAFLVTTSVTTVDGTFRFPASPKNFEPVPEPLPSLGAGFASPASAPAAKADSAEEPAELLLAPPPEGANSPWVGGPHITSHEIVLDLNGIEPGRWEEIREDVKKYFPAPALEVLENAKKDGKTVSIDLRAKTIELLHGDF